MSQEPRDTIEAMAEAIHAVEYGRFNPAAGEDHNKHTWPRLGERTKDIWREYAREAFAAVPADLTGDVKCFLDEPHREHSMTGWIDGLKVGFGCEGRGSVGAGSEVRTEQP